MIARSGVWEQDYDTVGHVPHPSFLPRRAEDKVEVKTGLCELQTIKAGTM